MECQIAGVLPVDGWNWSGECCIALRKLLVGMTVTAKLVGTLKSGHVHAVDILLSSGMSPRWNGFLHILKGVRTGLTQKLVTCGSRGDAEHVPSSAWLCSKGKGQRYADGARQKYVL